MRALRNLLIGLVTSLGIGIASGVYVFNLGMAQVEAIRAELPAVDEPGAYRPSLKTRVYAEDGTLLTEIYRENRELLRLADIPKNLRNATIAAEDRRFREHVGISPEDIARAVVVNLRRGRISQGASTITQQLARDVYLTRRRQLRRKVSEALLAIELEKRYSKDEILELYLNEINYGKGLYGVRTAAQTYFGKEPAKLSLDECAALAAIPQRPSEFHLYQDRESATRRRNRVLEQLCEQGYISSWQRDIAQARPLKVRPYAPPDWRPRHAPYYTSWAIKELVDLVGEEKVYTGGLKVITHLDLRLQQTAEEAVRNLVRSNAGRGAGQGAALLMDARSGAILAIVGGTSWDKSQFNRATQARRQPGSAFKPFVYTAAIDRGYRPTDRILDAPLSLRDGRNWWRPKNYDFRWHGEVTLRHALAMSINIPAIKLIQRVGPQTVIGYAQRMGIRSPLRAYPSLALGTSEVTLLELTSSYAVFANGGQKVETATIARVEDVNGKVIYEHRPNSMAVLGPQTARTMTDLLRTVITAGTGRPAALEQPCGGKTGTTQDGRDAWFVGFTPQYVCGVWLGNDDYRRRMRGVYGGAECGPCWRRIVRAAVARRGGMTAFTYPTWLAPGDPRNSASDGYDIEITGHLARTEARICTASELLATPHCPHPVVRSYQPGLAPTDRCDLHRARRTLEPAAEEPAGELPVEPLPTPEETAEEPPAALPEPEVLPPTEPLPKRSPKPQPAAPLLNQFVLCTDSGLLAKPACPHKTTVSFAAGEAPSRECDQH